MISTGKKGSETATRRERGKEDVVRGAQTRKVEVGVDDEEVPMVSIKVKAKNTNEVETEGAEEVGAEISEEMEKKGGEKNIFDTNFTDRSAAETNARQEVEV